MTPVTAEQPEAPAYFTYDAVLNAQEHAVEFYRKVGQAESGETSIVGLALNPEKPQGLPGRCWDFNLVIRWST